MSVRWRLLRVALQVRPWQVDPRRSPTQSLLAFASGSIQVSLFVDHAFGSLHKPFQPVRPPDQAMPTVAIIKLAHAFDRPLLRSAPAHSLRVRSSLGMRLFSTSSQWIARAITSLRRRYATHASCGCVYIYLGRRRDACPSGLSSTIDAGQNVRTRPRRRF